MNPITAPLAIDAGLLTAAVASICALFGYVLPLVFSNPDRLAAARRTGTILVAFGVTIFVTCAPASVTHVAGLALAVATAAVGTSASVTKLPGAIAAAATKGESAVATEPAPPAPDATAAPSA